MSGARVAALDQLAQRGMHIDYYEGYQKLSGASFRGFLSNC
jgi:hypothetical protein